MKKLRYFAALPLIATMLFGFSVEYVPTAVMVATPAQDSSVFRQRIKRTTQTTDNKKSFEEWRKTDEYKQKVHVMEKVGRRTLTGTVKYNPDPVQRIHENSVLFVSGNTTYLLMLGGGPERIRDIVKPNSIVTIKVYMALVTQLSKYVEVRAASLTVNGKVLYQMKPSVVPPFGYEVNKVRFADGLVTKVSSTYNGRKELQVSANGYTFLLKIDDQQVYLPRLDEVKVGDDVRFKFVHEEKTGAKTYLIKDWLSISNDIQSYELRNKLMFAKFYELFPVGRADSSEVLNGPISGKRDFGNKVQFTAKDSVVVDKTSKFLRLYGNATITLKDVRISAEEITFDNITQKGLAKAATLERKGFKSGPSDSIAFNLNTKKFNLYGIK
jgi:hypothetical protein